MKRAHVDPNIVTPELRGPRIEVDPFAYFARLARVRRYVDDHLCEDLSLTEVALIAAMNPSSFSRFFRRNVGEKFSTWLASRRIKLARELFRNRNHTVSSVSREVGYDSDRSFRRAFKAEVGCCPSKFRQKVRDAMVGRL